MTENEDWYGSANETDRQVLNDPATGKPVILRKFDFTLPPNSQVTEKELIEAHQDRLKGFLWKDELVVVGEVKCVLDAVKGAFSLFVPCQPRGGSNIIDVTKPLHRL